MIRGILAAMLLFCLAGCWYAPHGQVIGKNFVPAHDDTSVSISFDADGNISTSLETDRIPDRWYLHLRREQDGQPVYNEASVSQEIYDRTKIGDLYGVESQ